MTEMFLCNGCGSTLPHPNLKARLIQYDKGEMVYDKPDLDLCIECHKATQVFLNNRMNEKGKGVNTGFTISSHGVYNLSSNTPYYWSSGGEVIVPQYSLGERRPYSSVDDVPTNTPVNTNGEKKKRVRKIGVFTDSENKRKTRRRK